MIAAAVLALSLSPSRTLPPPTFTRTPSRTPTAIVGLTQWHSPTPGPSPNFGPRDSWPVPVGIEIDDVLTPHPAFTPKRTVRPYPCHVPTSDPDCLTCCPIDYPPTPGLLIRKLFDAPPIAAPLEAIVTTFTATPTYFHPPTTSTPVPSRTRTAGFTPTGGPVETRTPGPSPTFDPCTISPCTPTPPGWTPSKTPSRTRTPSPAPSPTAVPLRFMVNVTYTAPGGSPAAAQYGGPAGAGGWLWFFDPTNPELFVAVVDNCRASGFFYVKVYGGTNVAVDVKITDGVTGKVWTDSNPQGQLFTTVIDNRGFPCQ